MADDRDGYRWLCREMRKRFGETQNPGTADRIAKVCLLLPADAKDTEWAGALADRAVTLGKNDKWAFYYVFCKGLADYRRGNIRAAVAGLDPLLPRITGVSHLTVPCHLVLAMALQRQGETKAAREHLAKGSKLLNQHMPDLARFPMEESHYHHDWLIAWLLHREARTLIEGKKAESKK